MGVGDDGVGAGDGVGCGAGAEGVAAGVGAAGEVEDEGERLGGVESGEEHDGLGEGALGASGLGGAQFGEAVVGAFGGGEFLAVDVEDGEAPDAVVDDVGEVFLGQVAGGVEEPCLSVGVSEPGECVGGLGGAVVLGLVEIAEDGDDVAGGHEERGEDVLLLEALAGEVEVPGGRLGCECPVGEDADVSEACAEGLEVELRGGGAFGGDELCGGGADGEAGVADVGVHAAE